MKHETAKKKEAVDEKNVALQSLVYQKTNLLREINECKAFKTSRLYDIESYPGIEVSDQQNYDSIMAWLVQELDVLFSFELLGAEEARQRIQGGIGRNVGSAEGVGRAAQPLRQVPCAPRQTRKGLQSLVEAFRHTKRRDCKQVAGEGESNSRKRRNFQGRCTRCL